MLALDVLLLALMLALLAGASSNPEQNPVARQVDGIVGGSVSLTAFIPPEKTVAQIDWEFQPESGLRLAIADFKNGNLTRPNPSDRFLQQLKMANETTLRIKDLKKQDSGNYTAHVRFQNGKGQSQTFHLKVTDPNRGSTVEEGLNTWNKSAAEIRPVGITAVAAGTVVIVAEIQVIVAGIQVIVAGIQVIVAGTLVIGDGTLDMGAGILVMGAGILVMGAENLVIGAVILVIGAGILVIGAGILVSFLYRCRKGSHEDVTLRKLDIKVEMVNREPLVLRTDREEDTAEAYQQ